MDENNDILWKILSRFDGIISTTNSKAALTITFDTFVFGGIIIKWNDILPSLEKQCFLTILCSLFLLTAALASTVSLWYTFKAINPFLRDPQSPKDYISVLFFEDISIHNAQPSDYDEKITKLLPGELQKDLSYQAHILSRSMSKKFTNLKKAVGSIIYVQLPALGLFTFFRFIAFLAN